MTRLEQALGTAEGQARFIDWLSSDITQAMIQELRDKTRPNVAAADKPMTAAAELGRLRGIQEVLDTFTRYRSAPQPGGAGLPTADYGARETAEE